MFNFGTWLEIVYGIKSREFILFSYNIHVTHVYTKEYWCVKQVNIGICLSSSSDKGMLAIDIYINKYIVVFISAKLS